MRWLRRQPLQAGSSLRILEIANVDFAMRQFLLPIMKGLREAGHEVIGACAEGPHLAAVREEGFEVVSIPMARSFSPRAQILAFREVVNLIRRFKPDVVHAHMPISGIVARAAAFYCRVPRVAYTCHGFLFNQPGPAWRKALSFVLEFFAGRLTDVFMTVSLEEARDARRLHIHPDPHANQNGRDPARFHPDKDARNRVRTELGVTDDRVVILAVSRLVRHKGYPELLKAMEAVPGAQLWVVGSRLPSDHGDVMEAEFRQAASQLGSRLMMLGYRDDVEALMAAADIFTLPSHFEGLPMVIVEAMLTGLPVVATNIRGAREQVVDRETGYLVPVGNDAALANALNRLVDNAAVRQLMGREGLLRARAYFDEQESVARSVRLLSGASRLPPASDATDLVYSGLTST